MEDVKTIFGNLVDRGESVLVPSAVHLPKVDSPSDVLDFAEMFEQVVQQQVLFQARNTNH